MEQTGIESVADTVDVPGDFLATKLPSSTYLAAMAGSVALSVGLYLSGRREASIFVGLWAPTLLQFGIYNKLLRISRGTAQVAH